MALQGTLDTFALSDVLRLLSSTHKTGRVRVSAERGSGSIWLDGGSIVAAQGTATTPADPLTEVVFELLRHREGSFSFEPDLAPADGGAPADVEAVLRDAEALLAEWREIEKVVPSLDAAVTLSPTLPRPEVVIDAARWKIITAIGGGAPVRQVGTLLGLGEIEVCRALKDVIEIGVVRLDPASIPATEEAASVAPPETPAPVVQGQDAPAATAADTMPPADADDRTGDGAPEENAGQSVEAAEEAVTAEHAEGFEPAQPGHSEPVTVVDVSVASVLRPATTRSQDLGIVIPGMPSLASTPTESMTDPADDDEDLLRALGNLTPQAARAIAAAAQARTDADRDAALDQAIAANHEPLDRSLLLRFLSSVRQ